VIPVAVPTLQERTEDIPLLVSHIIDKCNQKMNKRTSGVSPQAMALFMAYSWPGNVRELENIIQRMMVVTRSEILDVQDVPPEIRGIEERPREKGKDLKDIARESARIAEKSVILNALAKTGGNVTQTARSLGVSRATLQTKMKTYGLRGSTK
jgi:two-component system NtrC family response regulator